MDHKLLLKKLFLMEFDLLGCCNVSELVDDDKSHGVKFTDAEKAEVRVIHDEAYHDWLLNMAGVL